MSTEENKVKLKPEVTALAETIKAGLNIDAKTGDGTADSSLYLNNLPEGLTKEIIEVKSNYDSTFVPAVTMAFGELAIDAMASNKSLERCSVNVPMAGKDNLDVTIDRVKTYPNHLTDSGATVKYGVANTNLEIIAGKNAGQLKKARSIIAEMAMDKLKD